MLKSGSWEGGHAGGGQQKKKESQLQATVMSGPKGSPSSIQESGARTEIDLGGHLPLGSLPKTEARLSRDLHQRALQIFYIYAMKHLGNAYSISKRIHGTRNCAVWKVFLLNEESFCQETEKH